MDVDTIVALATARGPAAIAVVRVSGPRALDVLARIAPEREGAAPRTQILTRIVDPHTRESIDQALVTVFAGPNSYTGEDVVEISGHGGWYSPALLLDACVAAGARHALPGEFTQRAYLNGRMDLVQAEAVLDVIEAKSPALHRAAVHQLERGLSARVSDLRERIVHLEALLAHHLDFPEEDDAPVPLDQIIAHAASVAASLEPLVRTAPAGEMLREGALTVLAGRPNSGKSSLFNALLGEERAIVTEIPGTTRDAIEAVVALDGFPFRLVDTAGLRESEDRVERLGIEVAQRYLARADLVLLCVEASAEGEESSKREIAELERLMEGRECPIVVVHTKADLTTVESDGGQTSAERALPRVGRRAGDVTVSVVSGKGLDALVRLLPSLLFQGIVDLRDGVVLTRPRQARAMRSALEEMTGFRVALHEGVPPEVAATHLRAAESALEDLLGVITPDDVLDALFRTFCIGK
jgi:tRNA modification GTPase